MMDIDVPSLRFNQPIAGRASIESSELRKRLVELHNELRSFHQGNVQLSSLIQFSKDLISKKVLGHSDKSVVAVACSCIVDILRLFAPNPPYKSDDMTRVFNTFAEQFKSLDPDNTVDLPFQHYVLASLSTVKTIVLVADVDDPLDITADLYTFFFNAAEKRLPHDVQDCLVDILTQLADVVPLSEDMASVIFTYISRNDDPSSPTFHMAAALCQSLTEHLQQFFSKYFTEAMIEASQDDESGMTRLKHVHDIVCKIFPVSPAVLQNVIPQLEEELTLDVLEMRILATETLGTMFAVKTQSMFTQYRRAWREWLGRRQDKSLIVRTRWLSLAFTIYQNHIDHSGDELIELLEYFSQMIMDPDEKIRTSVCQMLGQLDYDTWTHQISKNMIEALGGRCRDKKPAVRKEALESLGKMYNAVYHQLYEPAIQDKFGWIPTNMFHCIYVDDKFLTADMEETLVTYIFPEQADPVDRVDRLVNVVSSLDDRARKSLWNYMMRASKHIKALNKFLEAVDNNSSMSSIGDYQDTYIKTLVQPIADQFGYPAQVKSFLNFVSQCDDTDVLRSLRNSLNTENEYGRICSAQKSLMRRLDDLAPDDANACAWILNRTQLTINCKSNIPYLFALLRTTRGHRQSAAQAKSDTAHELLKNMALFFPPMCLPFVNEAAQLMMSAEGDPLNLSLEFLAMLTQAFPREVVFVDKQVQRLISFATEGEPRQATLATVALCFMQELDTPCADLVNELLNGLNLDNPNLVSVLNSLSQIGRFHANLLTGNAETVSNFIVLEVFSQFTSVETDAKNPIWEEYEDLDEIAKQKLAAIPVLSSYLTGMTQQQMDVNIDFVNDILKLLWALVNIYTVERARTDNTSAAEASHVRLLAARTLIQLAELPEYTRILQVRDFEHLGLLAQDECPEVRTQFGNMLMMGLKRLKLHSRYYTWMFLYAHEPDDEFFKKVKHFVQSQSVQVDSMNANVELSLVRLIHLLAHHPDYADTRNISDLCELAIYLKFYFSCLVTENNISFLYHVAQKLKTAVDTVDEDISLKSHVLADIASALLTTLAKQRHWLIDSDDHPIKLQTKLYHLLPPGELQKKALRANYIPPELQAKIASGHLTVRSASHEQTTHS
ncbi:hypothetical protein DM01DRAFT_1094332 [Hesseltinella vesiculosa]|uniref:ARM repeat-containing protein n=1 Tax=Hesseltinella vesiculosa TaxID=101127 RepID=A0A1X2GC46_9FUNG|nr:hypothetical protein DM01DRAFT_1094332 [Hesseltinella vesiculosa]